MNTVNYKDGVMSKPFIFQLIKYLNHQDFISFYSALPLKTYRLNNMLDNNTFLQKYTTAGNLKLSIDNSDEWETRLEQLSRTGDKTINYRQDLNIDTAKKTVRTIIALKYINAYIHNCYTPVEIYNMSQITLDSGYCEFCEYKPDPPKRITEYLPYLINLKRLELNTIQAKYLKDGMFEKLPQLCEIEIFHKEPIRELPRHIFRSLHNLERLELISNERSYDDTHTLEDTFVLEQIFTGLFNLKYLYFSNKQIRSLPETIFSNLTSLEQLKIHTSRVDAPLPEKIFSNLVKVKSIHFNYSDIETLPEKLFEGLIHLEEINFHHNKIIGIPKDLFSGLVNLERLDFSDNCITFLPKRIRSRLNQLEVNSYDHAFDGNNIVGY